MMVMAAARIGRAGRGSDAAADEGRHRGRVVRRPERPLAPAGEVELPGQAQHGGRGEGVVIAQGRQQAGQALGEHGLAGARRPAHQQ